jgi:hypothetical protein
MITVKTGVMSTKLFLSLSIAFVVAQTLWLLLPRSVFMKFELYANLSQSMIMEMIMVPVVTILLHHVLSKLTVREKSKDIVGLLTDDNVLAAARRNRNPPIERRPSSTGPITLPRGGSIQKGESLSKRRSSEQLSHRQSFEDLQDVDEDTAMAMAIEESKAVYESGNDLLENRHRSLTCHIIYLH